MTNFNINNLFANRIGGEKFGKDTTVYKFEKIKRAKRAAIQERPDIDILDFGVGDPDQMAHSDIVAKLAKEAANPENRAYADNGIPELKTAAVKYLDKVYGVSNLDPELNICHSLGAKSALAMLPSAFINPGDITLMTIPGYPVLGTHSKWYGGEVVNLPLKEENDFLPDLNSISKETAAKTKLMYINYPNNPTGAVATKEFYKKIVDFAIENNILIIQDAPYSALVYNEKPLSILSIDGAIDVCLEIHSFSKAYNMTGWRLAFLAGNTNAISAFAHIKDNYDSGQFRAIQHAGIYALEHPEITEECVAYYKRRLTIMTEILRNNGFDAKLPKGTFYQYVKSPAGAKNIKFSNAEKATEYLIKNASIVTVPWDDCGAFLRFSATFELGKGKTESQTLDEMDKRLRRLELVF